MEAESSSLIYVCVLRAAEDRYIIYEASIYLYNCTPILLITTY